MTRVRRYRPEHGQRLTLRSYKFGLVALALALSACGGTFFGESEDPPLPGTRIAILEASRSISAQDEIATVPVDLPPPVREPEWPQAQGSASHIGGHLALSSAPKVVWRNTDAVGADDSARRPLTPPVIADGRIYLMDSVLNVRAYDASTGEELWAVGSAVTGEHNGFGGGIAVDGGRVYVTGGNARAMALEAETGRSFWQVAVPAPVRGAPTVKSGQVLFVTTDDRLVSLSAENGERLWDVPGTSTGAALLRGASPAANDDAVVAALGTGEVLAVRTANGRELWRNSLAALRRFDFGAKLSAIAGNPAMDGNAVFAASAAGRTAGFSLRTGNRLWEQRVGSTQSPWAAGDWIFIVSTEAELIALERNRGYVRWVAPLQRFEDPEDQTGRYFYAGPVLAGGQLILVRSDGEVSFHSPEDGTLISTLDTGNDTILPPVVANETLYIYANDGTLTAFR